jgi:hypothetical protein
MSVFANRRKLARAETTEDELRAAPDLVGSWAHGKNHKYRQVSMICDMQWAGAA